MILHVIPSDMLCYFTDKMKRQFRWMYVIRTSKFLAALPNTIGGADKIRCHLSAKVEAALPAKA